MEALLAHIAELVLLMLLGVIGYFIKRRNDIIDKRFDNIDGRIDKKFSKAEEDLNKGAKLTRDMVKDMWKDVKEHRDMSDKADRRTLEKLCAFESYVKERYMSKHDFKMIKDLEKNACVQSKK